MFPTGPPPQAQDQNVPSRASIASSGSKRSPPDLRSKLQDQSGPRRTCNRKLRIRVVPRRTSTASSGSECSPPGLNRKESPKIYQIECQIECQKIYQKICQKMSLGGESLEEFFLLRFHKSWENAKLSE